MKKDTQFPDVVIKTVTSMLAQLSAHNGDFCTKKASEHMILTFKERVQHIKVVLKKEATDADLFDNINRHSEIPMLVQAVARVTLSDECLKYAKEIFDHSKL